jgi:tetratricopeptide (TPR) repeat protein
MFMAAPSTFLVVDQSKESQKLWADTLGAFFDGAAIEAALTAEKALESIEAKKVSLIIASWELQPMHCVAFMQRVRENSKALHIPILIFAGRLTERDQALAKEFDIPDFLIAPFEETKVKAKIDQMLRSESDLDTDARNLRKIEAWLRERRVSEALSLITSCLKKGPNAAKAYCLYGETWLAANKLEQAEKAFHESLKYDPGFSRSTNGLGKCYLRQNKFDEAMKIFEGLQRKIPGNISRLVTMGNAYLEKGDDEKARKYFDEAKSIDKENGDVAAGIGKIEFNSGNIEVASALFKASGKGEELASYYNGMAIAFVRKQSYDQAIKLYLDAISAIPAGSKEGLLHFNIGLAYKKSARVGDAADAFARATIANPGHLKALSGLINCAREAEKGGLSYDRALADRAIRAHKEFKKTEQRAS